MKKYTLLLAIIIPLVLISCIQKTKIAEPGIAIYKTNADYFNHTTCRMKDGKIVGHYDYKGEYEELSSRLVIIDEDTVSKYRHKLIQGYVVDEESEFEYDVFLDLTYKEYMELERENGGPLSNDILSKHILDKEPFIVYYEETNPIGEFYDSYRELDTLSLNELIRSGELDKYFTKKK